LRARLLLGAFDIHVSQNADALADLEAVASIVSFVLGLGLGLLAYRKITRRDNPLPATGTE
jgi:hypothetical protein